MVDTTPTVITRKIIDAGVEVAPAAVNSKQFQFTVTPSRCQRNEELLIDSSTAGDSGSSIKLRVKCTAENTTFTQARSRIAGEVAYSIGQAHIRYGI